MSVANTDTIALDLDMMKLSAREPLGLDHGAQVGPVDCKRKVSIVKQQPKN